MPNAYSISISGVVQGVGFRPFVYRLAREHGLYGWVRNGGEGVEIHLEGDDQPLQSFLDDLKTQSPPAARVSMVQVQHAQTSGFREFTIELSRKPQHPTTRISPDLPICDACLADLFDPRNPRFQYPFTNCSQCGPRYTVIRGLPYDRARTTMRHWHMDSFCASEYENPENRRFHAEPIACPHCGPHLILRSEHGDLRGDADIHLQAAKYLKDGKILAIKGLGGYHLACDARNSEAVSALRSRKFRKEKPFALMAGNLEVARGLVDLTPEAESLLVSAARPIVLARARLHLPEIAPGNDELGVMMPYTPLHHLLFAVGAPDTLVMTSANRSSEPIAFNDEEALAKLSGIADALLVGEREIARRVDDSVVRVGVFGPSILRRSRGYAPSSVVTLPARRPILALGADLKNTVTLVVEGQAFVSQHIGDLEHYEALRAFDETIEDLLNMYEVRRKDLLIVHDAHPQYASSEHASRLTGAQTIAVQHHKAHIASVLAEREAWDKPVIGVSFDGTGYGDDGTIWGGEFFVGSLRAGFNRIGHLRQALLPGGDAAATCPVQAVAGFVFQLGPEPDLLAAPFHFPPRYVEAAQLVRRNFRSFPATSVGRLFDAAAALLGFTREITYEGQAAIWLEQIARKAKSADTYAFPFLNAELDFRPLLLRVIKDREEGRAVEDVARAFQRGIAAGLANAVKELCAKHAADTAVLSGGVFQNELLLADLKERLDSSHLTIWTNRLVPANDGGISLGQAAIAAFVADDLVQEHSKRTN